MVTNAAKGLRLSNCGTPGLLLGSVRFRLVFASAPLHKGSQMSEAHICWRLIAICAMCYQQGPTLLPLHPIWHPSASHSFKLNRENGFWSIRRIRGEMVSVALGPSLFICWPIYHQIFLSRKPSRYGDRLSCGLLISIRAAASNLAATNSILYHSVTWNSGFPGKLTSCIPRALTTPGCTIVSLSSSVRI